MASDEAVQSPGEFFSCQPACVIASASGRYLELLDQLDALPMIDGANLVPYRHSGAQRVDLGVPVIGIRTQDSTDTIRVSLFRRFHNPERFSLTTNLRGGELGTPRTHLVRG
jgi:hypothetical protein